MATVACCAPSKASQPEGASLPAGPTDGSAKQAWPQRHAVRRPKLVSPRALASLRAPKERGSAQACMPTVACSARSSLVTSRVLASLRAPKGQYKSKQGHIARLCTFQSWLARGRQPACGRPTGSITASRATVACSAPFKPSQPMGGGQPAGAQGAAETLAQPQWQMRIAKS